jgi:hypothetical protein
MGSRLWIHIELSSARQNPQRQDNGRSNFNRRRDFSTAAANESHASDGCWSNGCCDSCAVATSLCTAVRLRCREESSFLGCVIGKSTSRFCEVTVLAFSTTLLTSHLCCDAASRLNPRATPTSMQHRGSSVKLTPRRCTGPVKPDVW